MRSQIAALRDELRAEFVARIDRAAEAFGTDFPEMREEMKRRFDLETAASKPATNVFGLMDIARTAWPKPWSP